MRKSRKRVSRKCVHPKKVVQQRRVSRKKKLKSPVKKVVHSKSRKRVSRKRVSRKRVSRRREMRYRISPELSIDELREARLKALDPSHRDKYGITILFNAAYEGDTEAVRRLLQAGADPNAKNLRFYFDSNGDEEENDESGSNTPLMGASNTEIVKLLLNRGADLNFQADDGTTPLISALHNQYVEIVKLLLKRGANPNIRIPDTDDDPPSPWTIGDTPLIITIKEGHPTRGVEIVKLLLKYGANPNIQNIGNQTALMLVIWNREPRTHIWTNAERVEIVKLLLKHGANPNLKDMDYSYAVAGGSTALNYAVKEGLVEIVKLLLAYSNDRELSQELLRTENFRQQASSLAHISHHWWPPTASYVQIATLLKKEMVWRSKLWTHDYIKHKKRMETREMDCSICLDPIYYNDLHITPCNHVFHEDCLSQWTQSTCPMCRKRL